VGLFVLTCLFQIWHWYLYFIIRVLCVCALLLIVYQSGCRLYFHGLRAGPGKEQARVQVSKHHKRRQRLRLQRDLLRPAVLQVPGSGRKRCEHDPGTTR
jgi:hypothetical protein